MNSPKGPPLGTETGFIQLLANFSAGRLRPNNKQDRNTVPLINKNKTTEEYLQTNEQSKDLQDQTDQINEEEISNLPEKQFIIMRVKMIQKISEIEWRHGSRKYKKCLTRTRKN